MNCNHSERAVLWGSRLVGRLGCHSTFLCMLVFLPAGVELLATAAVAVPEFESRAALRDLADSLIDPTEAIHFIFRRVIHRLRFFEEPCAESLETFEHDFFLLLWAQRAPRYSLT